MAERSRKTIGFRIVFAIFLLYGLALLIPGCAIAYEHFNPASLRHTEWQEITQALLFFFVAPIVLLGWWRPRLASVFLWCGAALSVTQVVGINSRTGDGVGGMAVAGVIFVGVPLVLAGAFFYAFAPSEPRTLSIVSK